MYRHFENKAVGLAKNAKGLASLLLIGLFSSVPGQILAQEPNPNAICPAGIAVDFNGNTGPFSIGEPIPVKVTLSMGSVAPDPTTYVDIFRFFYNLDCGIGESYPDCTPQGNTIDFIEESLATTNCRAAGDTTPILVPDQTGGTVEISVEQPVNVDSSIELQSTAVFPLLNSCDITFDVVVNALASDNAEKEVVEITGWGETDAVCRNEIESPETGASLSLFIKNPNAVFWVTKDFTDDNVLPANIHFYCDTGSYTDQEFQIVDPASGADGFITKGFVLFSIPPAGSNCRIWEGPVPDGYTESYLASAAEDAEYDPPPVTNDPKLSGCHFNAVKGGEFYCDITNAADPATITVNKEWVITNTGGDYVKEKAHITIFCDKYIEEMKEEEETLPEFQKLVIPQLIDGPYKLDGWLGDGESLVGLVDTTFGPATCHAEERVHASGVETVEDCSRDMELTAGGSAECTFVNSVFFEAIPTLSAYGKVLMVLMMLGLGVFGFRRLT